jgi:hypothetical protein
MNKKLLKLSDDSYAFIINGVIIKCGDTKTIRKFMKTAGLRDIDLAFQIMAENDDEVADFGERGGFIITQKFEEANLGFPILKEA